MTDDEFNITNNNYNIIPKGNNEVEKYMYLYREYKKIFKNDKKVVIFYHVGDFYEIYSLVYPTSEEYPNGRIEGNMREIQEDIELKFSKKTHNVYNDNRIKVFMGGVPIRVADKYIELSVNKNWTIILYTQYKKNENSKSFDRKFERIIGPGLNTHSTHETNNIMVIYLNKVKQYRCSSNTKTLYAGLSFIDTLTGELGTIELPFSSHSYDELIFDELIKNIIIKNPKYILIYADKCNYTRKEICNKLHINYYNHNIIIDDLPNYFPKANYQQNLFKNIYKDINNANIMTSLNLEQYYYSRISLSVLFDYIIKRNPGLLIKISKPEITFEQSSNLVLQNNSLEQLNIVNNISNYNIYEKKLSLLTLLDNTKTAIGKRLFRCRLMNPIINTDILNKRYDNIENFRLIDNDIQNDIISKLKEIKDMNKLLTKINNYNLRYYEILSIFDSCKSILELCRIIENTKLVSLMPSNEVIKNLEEFIKSMKDIFNIEYLREENIKCRDNDLENNIFNKGYNNELDTIQAKIENDTNLIDMIVRKLSIMIDPEFYSKKKDKNGTKSLINTSENTKLGIYLTTTKNRVDIIKKAISKQQSNKGYGLMIGNLKIKKEEIYFRNHSKSSMLIDIHHIKNCGNILNESKIKLNKLTGVEFKKILDVFHTNYKSTLENIIKFIGEVDVSQSVATISIENGYIRPVIEDDNSINNGKSYINVENIRHPLIEKLQSEVQYIGNDIKMGLDNQNGILLFGVNAVGKSSLMKSIGCCIIMAQAGMYVPASSFIFSPFRYLFTRICSNDNIFAGMSTFEVEMSEMKTIMNYADEYGIILGDEICSGTETRDATAIVAACIQELSKRKSNFLFATHLHYLSSSDYITRLDNVVCKHMSVLFDEAKNCLIYERKLQDGSGPASYGIEVCKSMGMKSEFMKMAQSIRDSLDDTSQMIIGKTSKYNNDKMINKCEVCLNKVAVDTHHIKFQCTADKNTGMIDHWHKDNKFNLVGLCKECHQSVHSSPPRLEIKGYITTNKGIELDFNRLDNEDNSLEHQNLDNSDPNFIFPDNNNVDDDDDELSEKINDYYSRGLSVKQIQNRLKKEGITMTQKKIKTYF